MVSDADKYVIRMMSVVTRRWQFLDFTSGKWINNPQTLPMYLNKEAAQEVAKSAKAAGAEVGEVVSLQTALQELHKTWSDIK